MGLSNDLISQFVRVTKDENKENKETTVYGVAKKVNGEFYVKLDGSDLLTPMSTTADVEDGERVTISIKDHAATITGNISSPAARTDTVQKINSIVTTQDSTIKTINSNVATISSNVKIFNSSFKIEDGVVTGIKGVDTEWITTESLEADSAKIKDLQAIKANVTDLNAEKIRVDNLLATKANVTDLNVEKARIDTLESNTITTDYLTANYITANDIKATYLTTSNAELEYAKINTLDSKYAKIDLANIETANVGILLNKVGLISDATIVDGHVTGYLDAVEVNANNITAGTLTVDRLIITGSDKSIVYEINKSTGLTATEIPTDTIHGDAITKRSIAADHIIAGAITSNEIHSSAITSDKIAANAVTAEKISVTDLESIAAKIGSFDINNALYSNEHSSYNSNVLGVYIGSDYISLGSGGKTWLKSDGSVSIGSGDITYDAINSTLNITADSIKIGSEELITSNDLSTELSNYSTVTQTSDAISTAVNSAKTEINNGITETLSNYSTVTQTSDAIESRVVSVEQTADNAMAKADSNETVILNSISAIQQLSHAISMLVVDDNGGTLFEQTEDGWRFNISELKNNVDINKNNIETVNNDINNIKATSQENEDLLNSIDYKTSYITVSNDENGNPCLELGKEDNDFKVRITNTSIDFMEGSTKIAYINNESLYIEKAIIKNELEIGEDSGFIWTKRENGNMGLQWVGGE